MSGKEEVWKGLRKRVVGESLVSLMGVSGWERVVVKVRAWAFG